MNGSALELPTELLKFGTWWDQIKYFYLVNDDLNTILIFRLQAN